MALTDPPSFRALGPEDRADRIGLHRRGPRRHHIRILGAPAQEPLQRRRPHGRRLSAQQPRQHVTGDMIIPAHDIIVTRLPNRNQDLPSLPQTETQRRSRS